MKMGIHLEKRNFLSVIYGMNIIDSSTCMIGMHCVITQLTVPLSVVMPAIHKTAL